MNEELCRSRSELLANADNTLQELYNSYHTEAYFNTNIVLLFIQNIFRAKI